MIQQVDPSQARTFLLLDSSNVFEFAFRKDRTAIATSGPWVHSSWHNSSCSTIRAVRIGGWKWAVIHHHITGTNMTYRVNLSIILTMYRSQPSLLPLPTSYWWAKRNYKTHQGYLLSYHSCMISISSKANIAWSLSGMQFCRGRSSRPNWLFSEIFQSRFNELNKQVSHKRG